MRIIIVPPLDRLLEYTVQESSICLKLNFNTFLTHYTYYDLIFVIKFTLYRVHRHTSYIISSVRRHK